MNETKDRPSPLPPSRNVEEAAIGLVTLARKRFPADPVRVAVTERLGDYSTTYEIGVGRDG